MPQIIILLKSSVNLLISLLSNAQMPQNTVDLAVRQFHNRCRYEAEQNGGLRCWQRQMKDQPEKKVSPIWHSDIPGMLGFLIVPLIAISLGMFLPFVAYLRHHDMLPVYIAAVGTGFVGALLLFFARLPLYRQHQFFNFGSRNLDPAHRRLYWLAYFFVAVSGILLVALLFAVGL